MSVGAGVLLGLAWCGAILERGLNNCASVSCCGPNNSALDAEDFLLTDLAAGWMLLSNIFPEQIYTTLAQQICT